MADFTAKNVILKDMSGNYLIPYTESELPDQTGNSGKVLSTNGTTTSWISVSAASGNIDFDDTGETCTIDVTIVSET